MSEEDVAELILQLQHPQVQQARITQRIAELHQEGRSARSDRPGRARRVSPPPPPSAANDRNFSVGQRVFIQNRIRHVPHGRRPNLGDRAAVVQRVSAGRVVVITYNGKETWRHPENLRRLSDQEHHNILEQLRK